MRVRSNPIEIQNCWLKCQLVNEKNIQNCINYHESLNIPTVLMVKINITNKNITGMLELEIFAEQY